MEGRGYKQRQLLASILATLLQWLDKLGRKVSFLLRFSIKLIADKEKHGLKELSSEPKNNLKKLFKNDSRGNGHAHQFLNK
jgi:hypothetical protein